MLITIRLSLQLNCFTDSTSLVLSKQTRMPTFTATLLSDNSKDALLCNQLIGQSYQISLDFGGFAYTYPTLNVLASAVSLTFPCTDVNNCDAAFLATSVSFKLTFPDTNTIVEDAVSTFAIDKYNRLNCLYNQLISYNGNTKDIKITADAQNCQFQIQTSQMATLKLKVYPKFVVSKQFPLTGVTNIGQLFTNMVINCDADFTGTQKRICNRILLLFQTSLDNRAEITLSLPAVIPGNTALYDRQSEISLFSSIKTISSSFVDQFDCYISQEAVFFENIIKLTYVMNSSMVYCAQTVEQFLGTFNRIVRILKVSDANYNDVAFKFVNVGSTVSLTTTKVWLECKNELSGEAECIQKIKKAMQLKNSTGIISREFYLDDAIVKQVQTSMSSRQNKYANAVVTMNTSSFCFTTTNNGDTTDFYQIQIQMAVGAPRFFPEQHQEVFSLQSQMYFPGNLDKGQEGNYCFGYSIQGQEAIYQKIYDNKDQTTGVISMLGTQIAISQINIASHKETTNYMAIASVLIVLSSVVWFVFSLKQMK
ncbi:Conserved_hypothetical protein [Hexamita inflata]|uniref:Transmembrane protein n=1 Tax=Hexamita inflata TaxID=28002 RepID=A0AA86P8S5_9EUKA|nr:Conserved hypothetical protein [Hexamita inflata]